MSDQLNAIIERLRGLPELVAFDEIIEAIRGTYDVDHVYYYAISLGVTAQSSRSTAEHLAGSGGTLRREGRQFAAMSYTPDWVAHYLEANFASVDPVMAGAAGRFDPLDWSELDWRGTKKERFRNEAAEFGIGEQGYTVPIRGPSGQFAIFTINKTCNRETWAKLITEHRTDFLLLAHFAHQAVLKLHGFGAAAQPRPLSNREKEALQLIAQGLGRGHVAERLGISENTLRVYLDSARFKVGALNVPHAVALAVQSGVIDPA